MSGRPLDVLEASLDEQVTVRLKGGTVYEGRLGGYDQHLNLVLETPTLVRAGPEGAVPTTDDTDDGDESEGEDEDEVTVGVGVGVDPEGVGETVIIRGDNLVSITT